MESRLSVAACDRSERWIIAPGIGALRQIELANRSSTDLTCRVRVDEPSSAAASPSCLVVPAKGARLVDIVIGKAWDPASQRRLTVVVEGESGGAQATFTQVLVPADSHDFDLELGLRSWHVDEHDGPAVVRLALWCVVRAVGTVPIKVTLDFQRHTALRFPTPASIALGCGETMGFEVPVAWHRSMRDERGWNHPPRIEAVATADGQRKTAVLAWDQVEAHLADLVTPDDRQPRLKAAYPLSASSSTRSAHPAAFRHPREENRLEQAVVAPRAGASGAGRRNPAGRFRAPLWASFALVGLALSAVALALFFFLRPGTRPVISGPLSVAPLALSPAPVPKTTFLHRTADSNPAPRPSPLGPELTLGRGGVAAGKRSTILPRSLAHLRAGPPAAHTSTLGAGRAGAPIVQLFGVEAHYVPPQHALRVRWVNAAQAYALVQVLDARSRVIASRSIAGATSTTFIVLPRGYRGQVAVEVTAFGHHGERVVQTASLSVGVLSGRGARTVASRPGHGAGPSHAADMMSALALVPPTHSSLGPA